MILKVYLTKRRVLVCQKDITAMEWLPGDNNVTLHTSSGKIRVTHTFDQIKKAWPEVDPWVVVEGAE